jgi:hypothetical protein
MAKLLIVLYNVVAFVITLRIAEEMSLGIAAAFFAAFLAVEVAVISLYRKSRESRSRA